MTSIVPSYVPGMWTRPRPNRAGRRQLPRPPARRTSCQPPEPLERSSGAPAAVLRWQEIMGLPSLPRAVPPRPARRSSSGSTASCTGRRPWPRRSRTCASPSRPGARRRASSSWSCRTWTSGSRRPSRRAGAPSSRAAAAGRERPARRAPARPTRTGRARRRSLPWTRSCGTATATRGRSSRSCTSASPWSSAGAATRSASA